MCIVIYEAGMTSIVTNDRNPALVCWLITKTSFRMGLNLFCVSPFSTVSYFGHLSHFLSRGFGHVHGDIRGGHDKNCDK